MLIYKTNIGKKKNKSNIKYHINYCIINYLLFYGDDLL